MEKNTESKFLTGLFWGLLIGGGLAVFLNTQSGRRLLKSVSEEGLESILRFLEDYHDLDEASQTPNDFHNESTEKEPQRRRFFRGIKRR